MEFFDLIQFAVDAQYCGQYFAPASGTATPTITRMSGVCPAAAFTAIGAAFETIGYWVQADLIDYLTLTKFGLWAPMLYILAAFGGLFSMAMGSPPKMYLWFFIGPAIYAWLLDTRVEVHGVEWMVGQVPQDQRVVWRQAEVGILNTNLHYRATGGGTGNPLVFNDQAPRSKVSIAMPFLWFDEVISHSVQWLVSWTGINRQQSSEHTTHKNKTSIMGIQTAYQDKGWHILSNSKWAYFDSITSVKLTSPELRDAFVTFTASECGDGLFESFDNGKYIAANHTKGRTVPDTVFKKSSAIGSWLFGEYYPLMRNLNKYVPLPITLKNALQDTKARRSELSERSSGGGSGGRACNGKVTESEKFRDSVCWKGYFGKPTASGYDGMLGLDMVRCDTYLDTLIYAFRWEAAHQYYQIMAQRPEHMTDVDIIYNLLYGWNIRDKNDRPLGTDTIDGFTPEEQLRNFMYNLILVYLFRNEIAIAKQPMDLRYASATQIQNVTEGWQRSLGSKSKYGELYTWALMMPYIQGVLLYLLTIAYPFCAVAMVVPGWHQTLLTWASFFAWVKLWDAGFAIVMTIERSLWAMLGNSSVSKGLLNRVVEMQNTKQSFAFTCDSSGGATSIWQLLDGSGKMCDTPIVWLRDLASSGTLTNVVEAGRDVFHDNLKLFDYGLTLGPNLDLDLANGYYIYIITALYFAVPAVTGQLVLGAKAGAAGMVSNAIGGISSESGRAAGSSFTGDITQRMKSNQSAIGEQAYAKEMRKGGINGLAGQALQARQDSSRGQMMAAVHQQHATGLQNLASGASTGIDQRGVATTAVFGAIGAAHTAANKIANPGAAPPSAGAPSGGGGGDGTSGPSLLGNLLSSLMGGGRGGSGGTRTAGSNAGSNLHFSRGNVGDLFGGAGEFLDSVMSNAGAQRQTGGGFRAVDRIRQALGGKGALGIAGGFGYEMVQHAAKYDMGTQGNQVKLASTAAAADASIRGFAAGQQAGGQEKYAGMVGHQAEYNARRARWRSLNNYGNRMGSQATALGFHAAALDAGEKPMDMDGMAMAGMLSGGGRRKDDSLQRAAGFWNPNQRGGYQQQLGAQLVGIGQSYGGQAINKAANQFGFNMSGIDASVAAVEATPAYLASSVKGARERLGEDREGWWK